jgi:hypothetical protein
MENRPTSLTGLGTTVFGIALSAALVASSYKVTEYLSAQAKYQAIDTCFQAATIKSSDTVTVEGKDISRTLSEPITPYYEKCMKDKGFQPSI